MKEKSRKEKIKGKRLVPCLLAVLFVVISAVYFYWNDVVKITQEGKGTYFTADIDVEERYLLGEEETVQEYTTTRQEITKIGVSFLPAGDVSGIDLYAELRDKESRESLEQWKVSAALLGQSEFDYFTLENPILGEGRNLELALWTEGQSSGELWIYGTGNPAMEGALTVNGREEQGSLAFSVTGNVEYIGKIFFCIAAGFVLLLLFLFWQRERVKSLRPERIFLPLALFLGCVYLVIFTPYTEPDEPGHVRTVFYYANLLTGQAGTDEDGNVLGRKEDVEAMQKLSVYMGLDNYNGVKEHFFEKDVQEGTEAFEGAPFKVPATAHLPQLAGTTLGLLLGLNAIQVLYLGRAFAFLFYLLCCYFAIKWIPIGKMVLFAAALLPFSLETAVSYSYDNTVIGLGFFMTAFVLRLKYKQESVRVRDMIFWIVATVWIAPCKIVYALLTLLIFLVPKEKFGKPCRYYLMGGLSIAAAGASLLLSRLSTITQTVSGEMTAGYTFQTFFSDLSESLMLLLRTPDMNLELYLKQLFGATFGWFDVHLQWIYAVPYMFFLFLAVLPRDKEPKCLAWWDKAWIGLICLGITGAIMASMLFTWTDQTDIAIDGIQGRYFLPILPLLVLLLRSKLITVRRNINSSLGIGICMAQFITCMQVFRIVIEK